VDPQIVIKPVEGQIDDLLESIRVRVEKNERVLVTTLTKNMSEDLTDYMSDQGIKVRYMHSDVDTLERIEIIRDLRLGVFDVLIGINLLREGLDIPECAFVGILDADKEGFLRSETSMIQTIGRAARNSEAHVVLYADKITGSMQRAMDETERRRVRQVAHNTLHGIIPQTILRGVADMVGDSQNAQKIKDERDSYTPSGLKKKGKRGQMLEAAEGDEPFTGQTMGGNAIAVAAELEKRMFEAAENLEFEEAARLRDELVKVRGA
jgi:excinuclease ABC subunit B